MIVDFFVTAYAEICESFVTNPVAQAIGFLSLLLSLASFQMKSRSGILALQCLASLSCAVSLIMLGGIAGGILDIVAFSRTVVFSLSDKYRWARCKIWLPFYFILIIAVGIITWDPSGIGTLFAIVGTLLSTLALYQKKPQRMRVISLFVGPCWIIYSLIYSSCFGMLNEIIAMVSIVIALWRARSVTGSSPDGAE